jgi:DivIVA domain-containing protein
MAQPRGFDLLTIDESAVAEASFDVSLRGYDRQQVDAFVARTDKDVRELERRAAAAEQRVTELTDELAEARAELERNRRWVRSTDGRPTYAALGRRVEQILTLAEQQAEDIRTRARETAVAAVSPSPPR